MAIHTRYSAPALPTELLTLGNLRAQIRQFEACVSQQLNQQAERNNTTFSDFHTTVKDSMDGFNHESENVYQIQRTIFVLTEARSTWRAQRTARLIAQGPNTAGDVFQREIDFISAIVEQMAEQIKEQKEVADEAQSVAKANLAAKLSSVNAGLETIKNISSASTTQITADLNIRVSVIKEDQRLRQAELDSALSVRQAVFDEWIALDKRAAARVKAQFEQEIQTRKDALAQLVAEQNGEIADRKMALEEREVDLKADLDRLQLDLEKFRIEEEAKVNLAKIAGSGAKNKRGCVIC